MHAQKASTSEGAEPDAALRPGGSLLTLATAVLGRVTFRFPTCLGATVKWATSSSAWKPGGRGRWRCPGDGETRTVKLMAGLYGPWAAG